MKILTSWLRSYLPVLDVDDDQLAEDLTLRGIAVEGVFELNDASGDSDGALFDMDITTNRVDAMNHYGVAREAAAIYDVPLHALDAKLPATSAAASPFPVRIEAPELCGRFTARVIRGVAIAPTEGRLAHWFEELGQKRISNAVDATNFVLLAMGHPTHAFDLDKIEGGIVVRKAQAGETLKLLDGTTRTLHADDLVVADEVKALGLAGVMGGYDSMITSETKNVLVEAAWFAPATIRASSRRHLIHTDASHRFERGADFAAAPVANALVCKTILAACGGQLEGELVDVVVAQQEAATNGRAPIELSVAQVRRHLGTTLAPEGITAALVRRFLIALGCTLTPAGEDLYWVKLPSWRLDLTREIDLIEEIARVYGYNKFANTLPTPGVVVDHPSARAERAVRARLLALGYSEALSSTFASAADCALFAPETPSVALENPLSEEAANLRPSLLPGMVEMLAQNLNRDVLRVRLFEAGAVFSGSAAEVQEAVSLSLGISGGVAAPPVQVEAEGPFYELKGAVESLLALFDSPSATYSTEGLPTLFEPGRAASALLEGKAVAQFGQLAHGEASRRKLRQPVWVADIDLATLLKLPLRQKTAREISRFQAVERDFSFVFPDAVLWGQISGAIRGLGIQELARLEPVEVWRNEAKFPGVYSTLVRTTFQSLDRTLRDEELSAWSGNIIAALQQLGGTLRS
jgi:phenylalanyl-tRNA synthetase beta chain